MELELRKQSYSFYDTASFLAGGREDTQEAIVPDAMPDILRIVAAYGTPLVSKRTLADGKAEVSGTVHVSVLYLPESGERVQALGLSVPFNHVFEARAEADAVLLAGSNLVTVDARTVNPRKIMVRASQNVWARVWQHRELELAYDIIAPHEAGVRVLRESRTAKLACAVGVREFTVSETVELPTSRAGAAEILRRRVELQTGEYNVIGKRVVFKGMATLDLLCRSTEDGIITHRAELPFSQIVEPHGMEDGAEVSLRLVLGDVDTVIRPDSDGRMLEITVSAEAQAEGYVTHKFETVGDFYSTAMKSSPELSEAEINMLAATTVRQKTVRDSVETDAPVRSAEDIDIMFSPVSVRRGDDGAFIMSSEADVRVLYAGEDGGMYSAQKRISIETAIESAEATACRASVFADGVAFSAAAISGVEVRFDACFAAELTQSGSITSIQAAKLEEYGDDAPERPSVVLRFPEGDETLWQIAKRYNAAEEDIREANALAPEEKPHRGKLLLIPKRR